MSEEQTFEQMLEASFKSIKTGEVVEGTVIDVKPDAAVLNINYKADGILTRDEYSADKTLDLTTKLNPGDKLQVKVIKVNDGEGQVALSYRKMAQERANKELEEAFNNKTVLTAPVVQVLSGGVVCEVSGARVFIPASLVSDTFVKDLTQFQGKELSFVITEFDPSRRRIIGNRKQLLVAEKEKKAQELLSSLRPGDVVEGTVRNVTDFGAFVDLGGVDGLLHVSEMGWGRVGNPKKLYKSGEKVNVIILSIEGKKIALSQKFPEENPWLDAETKFAPGTIVTGKVARLTDFGAFVELAKGVDGLLHVSQISKERVEKPADVLKVGDEVTAKIIKFEPDTHKISLSVRAIAEDEERAKREAERAKKAAQKAASSRDDNGEEAVTFDIDAYIAKTKNEEENKEEK
ncbi:MAG: 30S ribosomal protein S1 [Lachnospiraceae bacterium]|jgi:small subunit ribosomal protein S1/4-hydroxy-3-methylbut-2-enyl diphosphate reductase|nr:30S ribosomal protein S1 [Lachnospiraceae bacterium]